MTIKGPQLARWPELPDPRGAGKNDSAAVTMFVQQSAWQHFHKHVVSQEEPWEDWLTRSVWEDVWNEKAEGTRATLDLIGQAVRISLEKPLVLRQQAPWNRNTPRETWILVLPSGVQAVAYMPGGAAAYLQTCFYPQDAAVEDDPAWRWRRTRRWIVLRYTDDPLGQQARYPGPAKVFRIGERTETNLRYVTAASWGFTRDTPGDFWRDVQEIWPEPREPLTSATPVLALDPRPNVLQDETDHG